MTREIEITVDGKPVASREGDSVAAALWNAGQRRLKTSVSGEPRGWLCAMGSCYECLLLIDGQPRRACVTPCSAGMMVSRIDLPAVD